MYARAMTRAEEDQLLRELWRLRADGQFPTDRELGRVLGLAPSTVRGRRSSLGLARVRAWTKPERAMVERLWKKGRTDKQIVSAIASAYPDKPRPKLHQVGKVRRELGCFRGQGRANLRDYALSSLVHELRRRGYSVRLVKRGDDE
jgi:hypothetical protein